MEPDDLLPEGAVHADVKPSVDVDLFLKVFEQHKSFTEELLRENERLRSAVFRLRDEMREIGDRARDAGRVPELEERVRSLEEENDALRRSARTFGDLVAGTEGTGGDHAARYEEMERQNSHLVSMYVSMYRLHSTISFSEVLQSIKEIVNNMVGAEMFELYVFDEQKRELSLLLRDGPAHELSVTGIKLVREAITSGETYLCPYAERHNIGHGGEPVAVIPFKLEGRVMGVMVIFELLVQKDGFEPIDNELFDLMGAQAAAALVGSYLYSRPDAHRTAIEGLKNGGGGREG